MTIFTFLIKTQRVMIPLTAFSNCFKTQEKNLKKAAQCFKQRGLVSKETVVLRRWGRETQNFGFIN